MPNLTEILSTAATKLYDRLMNGTEVDYNAKDQRMIFAFSVGESRASTRVELNARDLNGVIQELKNFDPDEVDESRARSVPEVVRATLAVERKGDGSILAYSFKVSDKPHSRTVVLSPKDWPDFIRFLEDLNKSMPRIQEKYTALISEAEGSETEPLNVA